MEHIENHPHAILDSNNIVIGCFAFDGHDSSLLEDVKKAFDAADIKCCCDHGITSTGGDFFNGKLYPPRPYPEWVRDEEKGDWVAPEGWVKPDTFE